MKKFSILLLSVLLTACQAAHTMKLTSTAFKDQESIPTEYTCKGEDKNPPLSISDVPQTAQSLALILDDPDAPSGTWTHWTLWNIPPTTTEIPENWTVPASITEGLTSFGKQEYGGPCPPSGIHHYQFKLFALDQTLDLPGNSTVEKLMSAMEGHVLDSALLIGTYP